MKNLINTIESNKFLNDIQKQIIIDSITLGDSVSGGIRMEQIKLKMAILEILYNTDDELTVTEIQNKFAHHYGWCYTVQRFSAMANQLRVMGLVNKNYITTGNYLVVCGRRGKEPERIAKFSFKKA